MMLRSDGGGSVVFLKLTLKGGFFFGVVVLLPEIGFRLADSANGE